MMEDVSDGDDESDNSAAEERRQKPKTNINQMEEDDEGSEGISLSLFC